MTRANYMNGRQLSDAIVELAHGLGYRAAHFGPSLVRPGTFVTNYAYDGKGFPDLILVGRGRLVALEVKGDRDSVTDEQVAWLNELSAAGITARVVTSRDWRDGEVDRILRHA